MTEEIHFFLLSQTANGVNNHTMPNPRNKHSKRRTRARRTHHKVEMPTVSKCQTTGEAHIMHHAYYDDEGNMRYKGKILVKTKEE